MEDKFVIPGDVLGNASSFTAGGGTYTRNGSIRASVLGLVKVEDDVLSVKRTAREQIVPFPKSVVVCRIYSVNQSHAKANILSVNGCVLREPLRGIVRREDIRATERDTVEVFNSFRPRDIVRARVLGLGESQAYLLTTAENTLGVMLAKTFDREEMAPVSWCEFQGTVSGRREKRKVAKLVDTVSHVELN